MLKSFIPALKAPTGEISTFAQEVTIIGEGVPQLFEADEENPAVRVVTRQIGDEEYKHLEPVEPGSYLFGGNFAYTCDGRFPNPYPLPIHDRQESGN